MRQLLSTALVARIVGALAGASEAWRQAPAAVPTGWRRGLKRCASQRLASQLRSDDWIAVAPGHEGQQHSFRAADPIRARSGPCADLALT